MKLTFIGHGYVGLVTATVFADLGNTVYVIGHTPEKIENLKKGIIPFYEPGLSELVKKEYRRRAPYFYIGLQAGNSGFRGGIYRCWNPFDKNRRCGFIDRSGCG